MNDLKKQERNVVAAAALIFVFVVGIAIGGSSNAADKFDSARQWSTPLIAALALILTFTTLLRAGRQLEINSNQYYLARLNMLSERAKSVILIEADYVNFYDRFAHPMNEFRERWRADGKFNGPITLQNYVESLDSNADLLKNIIDEFRIKIVDPDVYNLFVKLEDTLCLCVKNYQRIMAKVIPMMIKDKEADEFDRSKYKAVAGQNKDLDIALDYIIEEARELGPALRRRAIEASSDFSGAQRSN